MFTKWRGFRRRVRQIYGIPDGFEPVAAIAVGYPEDPNVLPEAFRQQEIGARQRKAIDTFVFEAKWGETSPLVG